MARTGSRARRISPAAALRRLLALRLVYGPAAANEKRRLLAVLGRGALASARALVAFHEALLFLRAYPDDAEVAAAADELLARFARRRDLARHRAALAGSGLAGTVIPYPFFYPTALWLARRFPGRLTLDEEQTGDGEALRPLLLAALAPPEALWLHERKPPVREALRTLAGDGDPACFLLARIDAMPGDGFTREALHDAISPSYLLRPDDDTPSRTLDRAPRSPLVGRSTTPRRERPDLADELVRPPLAVREVAGREAVELVELARRAMVTRERDLDCFCYGDPRDVRRFRHEDGLELVAIGSRPERRLLLAAAYGLLTLRNGVPIGYVQLDGFLGTTLVHFNTFETFRGADAAWVFARALATARVLFGSHAFAIEPYQLGHLNDEALDSGAWWFYARLGFAPRDAAIAALAAREAERRRRRPAARSSRRTLAQLARGYLYWEPEGRTATVPPHAAASHAISTALAALDGVHGSQSSERAGREWVARIAGEIGLGPGTALTTEERLWLGRWAPLLATLPGISTWSREERLGLGAIVRAKAGRRESAAVQVARSHPRFGPALLELAAAHGYAEDERPRR
ncbi:MAG: hypothetical protein IPJ17_01710 [Holophagales bacterium]|nr:MAG: hypothetical protein IPJ17_01710 [Holophagales bacterium]